MRRKALRCFLEEAKVLKGIENLRFWRWKQSGCQCWLKSPDQAQAISVSSFKILIRRAMRHFALIASFALADSEPCTLELGKDPGTCSLPASLGEFTEMPGACRGSNVNDNLNSYYEVKAVQESECKQLCQQRANCTGVETSSGRCELWTRKIEAFKNLSSFKCWQKNHCWRTPSVGEMVYETSMTWDLSCPEHYEASCESASGYFDSTKPSQYPHHTCSLVVWMEHGFLLDKANGGGERRILESIQCSYLFEMLPLQGDGGGHDK